MQLILSLLTTQHITGLNLKLCSSGNVIIGPILVKILLTKEILEESTVEKRQSKLWLHRLFNIFTEAMKTARLLAVLPLLLIARQLSGERNFSFNLCFMLTNQQLRMGLP